MLSVEGEVHGLLAFQSCALVVVISRLRLQHHALVLGVRVEFLIADAVAVLPVVATVVDAFERNLVHGVELIVEGKRVALSLACDVILSYLCLLELYLAFLLHIFKLGVV